MSKIVIETKKGRTTIINKLVYPEAINERVYNAIASGMFEGFLPITIRQKRKEVRLECTVQGMTPFNQYFNGYITKQMFLDFVHRIVLQIKNCQKNSIHPNNLDLQKDRIFIDPYTKAVQCVYWPVVNNQNSVPPYIFLRQLPYELNINPFEDTGYLETYKAFFNGVDPFSVNNFEKMILRLQGRQTSTGGYAPSGALSGALSYDNKPDRKANEAKSVVVEYDPFAQVAPVPPAAPVAADMTPAGYQGGRDHSVSYCTSCGAKNIAQAIFCASCGTRMAQEPVKPAATANEEFTDTGTTVLGDDTGGTTVLGYDEPAEPVYPVLLRNRTGETVTVNKPIYRIGTEQRYCDFFISDNTFISRSHADIITKNERYYIVDKNSTNRTYVDGKVIGVEQEVEIFPGTSIRLANEDFTFTMES